MATDSATYSVLLVDADDGFLGETKSLLDGHKVYTARNISDAQRKLVEEGIDLAIVGPTFAHEAGVSETTLLFDVQPSLPVLLVSEGLNTTVLRAALRGGIKDVMETPLTVGKLAEALGFVEQIQAQRGDDGRARNVPEAPRRRSGAQERARRARGGGARTGTGPDLLALRTDQPIFALCPPSTGSITPVMNFASSEARNSAA